MVTKSTSIDREMKKRQIFKITVILLENAFISDTSIASNFAKLKRFIVFLICYVIKDTFELKFVEMCL